MERFEHQGIKFTVETQEDGWQRVLMEPSMCVFETDTPENRAFAAEQLMFMVDHREEGPYKRLLRAATK